MSFSERADSCLASLDDAGQAIAQRILSRLVSGDGGADDTRRLPLSTLCAGEDPERVEATVRALADARLVQLAGEGGPGPTMVELAREATAAWPALQAWFGPGGETEQLRRQLESDAAAWSQCKAEGRDDVGLLDKAQLSEFDAWRSGDRRNGSGGLSDVAMSYIAASRAAVRRRWWPGRASAGTVLAIGLTLLIMATPITLLLLVMLIASVIHRLIG